jgi:hypothetical protein
MSKERSRIDWVAHVARQRKSGLSVKEYCKRGGFSVWSFYVNRKRIVGQRRSPRNNAMHSASEPVSFMHFGAVPITCGMRIYFPDGTRVECDGSLGKEGLSYLLSALRGTIGGERVC